MTNQPKDNILPIKETTLIPIDRIDIDENVRKKDITVGLNELEDAIRQQGQLHAIRTYIHEHDSNGDPRYMVILGQRRVMAFEALLNSTKDDQYKYVRSDIVERPDGLDNEQWKAMVWTMSTMENTHQKPLHPADMTRACTFLYNYYLDVKIVSEKLGLSVQKVRECINEIRLIPELKKAVKETTIGVKQALKAQDGATDQWGDIDKPRALELTQLATHAPKGLGNNLLNAAAQEENKDKSIKQIQAIVADEKSKLKVTMSIGPALHKRLKNYADSQDEILADAASALVEKSLDRIAPVGQDEDEEYT